MRTLDEVLDFAPIELELRQRREIRRRDIESVAAGEINEIVPDLAACVDGEVCVREEEVDPRLEGMVKAGLAVGGQETDTLVVFELGEKDF